MFFMVKSKQNKGKGAQISLNTPKPALTEVKTVGSKKGLMHNSPFRDGISNLIPGGELNLLQYTAVSITGQTSVQLCGAIQIMDLSVTAKEGTEKVFDRIEATCSVLYENGGAAVALQYPLIVFPFIAMGPDGLAITNKWVQTSDPVVAAMSALSGDKAFTSVDWFGTLVKTSSPETYRYWNGTSLVQDWGWPRSQHIDFLLDLKKPMEDYQRLCREAIKSGVAIPKVLLGLAVFHEGTGASSGALTVSGNLLTMTHERATRK